MLPYDSVGQGSSLVTAVALVTVVAQVGSLAWELPHAIGVAKKKKKKTYLKLPQPCTPTTLKEKKKKAICSSFPLFAINPHGA